MDRQRDQARSSSKFKQGAGLSYEGRDTQFLGYTNLASQAEVTGLFVEGSPVEKAVEGQSVTVVLSQTPFYAESGGQVGDAGELVGPDLFVRIDDTQKISPNVFGHSGQVVRGSLSQGARLDARVDVGRRAQTARNHSVTHLMHKALREVLGDHVQQKGSLVDADKTRFDFSHNQPVSVAELHEIERRVNAEILENTATRSQVMGFDEAVAGGAMALFGEKYGDEVRVLDIGSSRELCGGTHVSRTGDIGLFKIVAESGVAAGIRRLEAITGERLLNQIRQADETLALAAALLKAPGHELTTKLAQVIEQSRQLEKELARLKTKLASASGDDLASSAIEVNGVKLLVAQLQDMDAGGLRGLVDQLKDKMGSAAIVLAGVQAGKISLVAGVTKDLTARVKAGDLVNHVAQQIGGKGGGRPDMAQGGGVDTAALPQALQSLTAFVTAGAEKS
jgi:alanyl-tRNA synthetase